MISSGICDLFTVIEILNIGDGVHNFFHICGYEKALQKKTNTCRWVFTHNVNSIYSEQT